MNDLILPNDVHFLTLFSTSVFQNSREISVTRERASTTDDGTVAKYEPLPRNIPAPPAEVGVLSIPRKLATPYASGSFDLRWLLRFPTLFSSPSPAKPTSRKSFGVLLTDCPRGPEGTPAVFQKSLDYLYNGQNLSTEVTKR